MPQPRDADRRHRHAPEHEDHIEEDRASYPPPGHVKTASNVRHGRASGVGRRGRRGHRKGVHDDAGLRQAKQAIVAPLPPPGWREGAMVIDAAGADVSATTTRAFVGSGDSVSPGHGVAGAVPAPMSLTGTPPGSRRASETTLGPADNLRDDAWREGIRRGFRVMPPRVSPRRAAPTASRRDQRGHRCRSRSSGVHPRRSTVPAVP